MASDPDHGFADTMNRMPGEPELPSRDDQIQALLDKEALHDLAMRYARAIDRRDRELLLSVYHEDAVDHHGTLFQGSALAFADWQPEVMAPFDVTAHHITNTAYHLDGDRAEGELYFVAYHRVSVPEAKEIVIGGRYLDRYERRHGRWKISRRTLVWDFVRSAPVEHDQLDFLKSLGTIGTGEGDLSSAVLQLFGVRRA